MIRLTPREEELLSYLTGLGPVGQWVYGARAWIYADLGLGHRSRLAQLVAALVKKRLIRAWGREHYLVLRRVEDEAVMCVDRRRPKEMVR